MKHHRPKLLAILAASISVVLSGCATDLKAVRGYAGETKKIAAAFNPYVAGTQTECEKKTTFKALFDPGYKPVDAQSDARAICAVFAVEHSAFIAVNATLTAYAEQLLAVAGGDVATALKDDVSGLAATLTSLQKADGTAVLPPERVSAVSALLQLVARSVLAHEQERTVREMLSHYEAVESLSDALTEYLERAYGGNLKDQVEANVKLETYVNAERARNPGQFHPLLRNVLIERVYQDNLRLERENKAIQAFRKSVKQMQKTHLDLRDNVTRLSDQQRLNAVVALAQEVRALYKQLNDAF